jgi:hypothetical protein
MNLTIRYFDRKKYEIVWLEIPADVLTVLIAEQAGLPALGVTVNTDTVLIDTQQGRRLGGLEFTEVCYAAKADD